MLKFVKSSVAAAALIGAGIASPAMAQSASEMAVRMQQLEEQVRQLTGQVQELTFEVKQLRKDAPAAAVPQQSGAAQPLKPATSNVVQIAPKPAPASQPSEQKRLAAASAGAPIPDSNGVETIEQQPLDSPAAAPAEQAGGTDAQAGLQADAPADGGQAGTAPGVKVFGALDNAAAQPNDGGFQGKVLVPPSQQDAGDDYVQQSGPAPQASTGGNGDSIETVSLQPDSQDTPQSLYERSYESLWRKNYGAAQSGFTNFLQKYPDHSLAGSAQYWLGETYFAQNDFQRAAASFLLSFKNFPDNRRAPESMVRLGMALNRLGKNEDACAAFASVDSQYPKAVEARKRAQAEAKRAGCAS